jgi:hypothetical protein
LPNVELKREKSDSHRAITVKAVPLFDSVGALHGVIRRQDKERGKEKLSDYTYFNKAGSGLALPV